MTVHLLTYSMVQIPSWEANWFAASQEIPRTSRNPKVHYRTHHLHYLRIKYVLQVTPTGTWNKARGSPKVSYVRDFHICSAVQQPSCWDAQGTFRTLCRDMQLYRLPSTAHKQNHTSSAYGTRSYFTWRSAVDHTEFFTWEGGWNWTWSSIYIYIYIYAYIYI